MPELGVATNKSVVLGQVDRVVIPLLHGDERQVRAVADTQLHVGGTLGGALVGQHHGRLGEPAGVDDQVVVDPRRSQTCAQLARDRDAHRLAELGLVRDGQQSGLLGAGPGSGGRAVGRAQNGTEHTVAGLGFADLHTRGRGDVQRQPGLVGRLDLEQAAETVHRREAPVLLASAGDREVRHVIRGLAFCARLVGDVGRRGVRVGL